MASFNSLFVRLQPLVRVPFRTHVGYMPFEGPVVPKDSSAEILKKELKIVNLKPVTRIHFKWDPLHPRIKSARDVMFYLSAERIRATNPKCAFKTDVLTDRTEASLRVTLDDGRALVFKLANLNVLDVISILNKHVLPLVKIEKESILESKGAAKMASKKKR